MARAAPFPLAGKRPTGAQVRQHARVRTLTCFAHEGLYALPLRPALVCSHLGEEGGGALALQGRVCELDDEAVGADLPVLPAVGAFEAAEQGDGAAEVWNLFQLHWGEAGVTQGTAIDRDKAWRQAGTGGGSKPGA